MKQYTLQAVKEAFQSWRALRSGKTPTPDYLKERVLTLIDQYPKQVICKELQINHRALKSWQEELVQGNEFITLPEDTDNSKAPLSIKIRTPQGLECELSGSIKPSYLAALIKSMNTGGVV